MENRALATHDIDEIIKKGQSTRHLYNISGYKSGDANVSDY